MKAEEIYKAIETLAAKDEFWKNILRAINEGSLESREERLEFLEEQGFENVDALKAFYESDVE